VGEMVFELLTNEIIFLGLMAADLLLILAASKFGKNWLFVLIVANLIMVQLSAAKLIQVFGFTTSSSTIFYSAIFIATDILTEHWGKKEGYNSVRYAFLAVVFIIAFGFIGRLFVVFDPTPVTAAIDLLFNAIPRITFASLLAYVVAQNFDIWLYHIIREKTGGKYLWLRNNGSTFVSQGLDQVIFFVVGFYGVVPYLGELIVTGYFVKVLYALIDTPFIYLSYKVMGKSMPIALVEKRHAGIV
jgi:queuosine precursor transporter